MIRVVDDETVRADHKKGTNVRQKMKPPLQSFLECRIMLWQAE
jgi:hypothetical protein